jgi:hypothetical protein
MWFPSVFPSCNCLFVYSLFQSFIISSLKFFIDVGSVLLMSRINGNRGNLLTTVQKFCGCPTAV